MGPYVSPGVLHNFDGLADRSHAKRLDGNISVSDEYGGIAPGIIGLCGTSALLRDKVIGSFDFEQNSVA